MDIATRLVTALVFSCLNYCNTVSCSFASIDTSAIVESCTWQSKLYLTSGHVSNYSCSSIFLETLSLSTTGAGCAICIISNNSCLSRLKIKMTQGASFPVESINQSINQSWIYIAHTRKASNALVR